MKEDDGEHTFKAEKEIWQIVAFAAFNVNMKIRELWGNWMQLLYIEF